MKGIVVRKGADGKKLYYAIVYVLDAAGRRKQKWLSGESRPEVEVKKLDVLYRASTGQYIDSRVSFGEFAERCLNDWDARLSPSTLEAYRVIVRVHLNPKFGKIPLRKIAPDSIANLYSVKRISGLSGTTVRNIHRLLHRILAQAVRYQLLAINPADRVDPPRKSFSEMAVLTDSEIELVLETAITDGPYFAYLHTSIFTGMRRGELLGLKWSDVDLVGAEISVTRSLYRRLSGEFVLKQPKSARSSRQISLDPMTCQVLRRHLDAEMLVAKDSGIKFVQDRFVFCHGDGSHWLPHTISQYWHRLAKKLGIKARLHDLRHSHASMLLKLNVHPKIVSERLGHSSVSVTLDLYSHVVPGLQERAAKALGDVFEDRIRRILDDRTRVD